MGREYSCEVLQQRICELERQIVKLTKTDQALSQRLTYERMLADISSAAISIQDIPAFLDDCVRTMGDALNVSGVFIWQYDLSRETLRNTHEWVARGVTPVIEHLQEIPCGSFPWFMEAIQNNQVLNYADIEDIPGEQEKNFIRELKIKSLLVVPLFLKNTLFGFIGFEEYHHPTPWMKEDIDILKTVAQIITKSMESKRSEDASRKSAELLCLFVECTPAAVAMCDRNMCYLAHSARWVIDYGLSQQDLIGLCHYDVFPEIPEHWKAEHQRCLAGEIIVNKEEQFKRADGSSDWVRRTLYPWQEKAGEIGGLILFTEVITERKRAEAALRLSEEKFRTLFEMAPMAYQSLDETGRLVEVNPAWLALLGYSREEVIGRCASDFLPPGEEQKFKRNFLCHNGESEVLGLEIQMARKDGSQVVVLLNGKIVQDDRRQAKQTHCILYNITGQRKAEQERNRLEAQLRQAQKMEAIGTLAGGIAHDFNNLLMGIQGNASLMRLNMDAESPNYEMVKNIESNVKSGATLTKQLLGFARSGKYVVMPTNLNEMAEQTLSMFARTRKEIKIHKRFVEKIWMIEADRGQLEQVLLNLYLNASQAMPEGGDLYLQTDNVILSEHTAKPYNVVPGRYVQVTVKDTGIGMDQETRQRVFEPFFTTKKMGKGTGLGLASTFGIIKNHGGFIEVESERLKGSTFKIYLPSSNVAQEVTHETRSAHGWLAGTETILLVDDEVTIIEVIKPILQQSGYKVLIAGDGKEAIDIYARHKEKIDMVILDMIMPGMGGSDLYHRLKEINPHLKVLLSSGYSIEGQAAKIMKRGCNGFIQKPYDLHLLFQKVRQILDKGQAEKS